MDSQCFQLSLCILARAGAMSTVCFLFWVSAGHLMISNHLLNYFPRLDIERRNCHGFTALMKAAMQGRAECVRALMMAGNDTPRLNLP